MAARPIIGSSVRPLVLIRSGIKERSRGKRHCRVPHPLERGVQSCGAWSESSWHGSSPVACWCAGVLCYYPQSFSSHVDTW
jgi:hypothetical protein